MPREVHGEIQTDSYCTNTVKLKSLNIWETVQTYKGLHDRPHPNLGQLIPKYTVKMNKETPKEKNRAYLISYGRKTQCNNKKCNKKMAKERNMNAYNIKKYNKDTNPKR